MFGGGQQNTTNAAELNSPATRHARQLICCPSETHSTPKRCCVELVLNYMLRLHPWTVLDCMSVRMQDTLDTRAWTMTCNSAMNAGEHLYIRSYCSDLQFGWLLPRGSEHELATSPPLCTAYISSHP
jgi:hypothetical protein